MTCLRSAHEALRAEMPVLRLAPSPHSARVALRHLLLYADNRAQEDAQIALGLVELAGGAADCAETLLRREASALGGSIATSTTGLPLLVTTRGVLAEMTGDFTALPMLCRLAERYPVARIGFGLGRTAAEAESQARRALSRARRLGEVAAILSLRGGTDLALESSAPSRPGEASLAVIARRVGLSVPTLQRLRTARDGAGASPLTTREVATRLGVQQRTARRMLQRLELAGLAERTGSLASGASGRPLTLYRLTI